MYVCVLTSALMQGACEVSQEQLMSGFQVEILFEKKTVET